METGAALVFGVAGMTCASCVGRVERALRGAPGVEDARANFATGVAQVRLTPGGGAAALIAALQDAGHPAETARTTLDVTGMTCASCVGRVERALRGVPGVAAAAVNLATQSASVDHLAAAAIPAALIAAAERAGYAAQERAAGPDREAARAATRAAEVVALGRQTLLAAALTLPVFVLEMGAHAIPALHHLVMTQIGMRESWLIQCALATLVLFGPGLRFQRLGWPALARGAPDMNSLVALGTVAAWGFSTLALVAPQLLPQGAQAVYFEAAAMIVTLILLGRWLETRARGRAGAAIARLMALQPRTARVERDGALADIAIAAIRRGDVVHVRPGERLAADGAVVSGASWVDESMITGEPAPVRKTHGATVTAGTMNGTGALAFAALRVGADTTLAQIVRLVEQAQGARLPIQSLADRITRRFVPAVLGLAALTVALWLALGPTPALSHALTAGVAVLIIACPCAMGLATPMSIMVGAGRAAELGVLFRRGDALQALQGVTVVALDKTGTLTEGRPALVAIETAPGHDADATLRLAAAVEALSEHPLAQAVVRAAAARGLKAPAATDFAALPGLGVSARVEGRRLLIGSARLMAREGVALGPLAAPGAEHAAMGRSPLYVAVDGRVAALLAVADRVKATTPAALAALRAMGLRLVMITGDNRAAAEAVAADLGIAEVVAEALPQDKLAAVRRLQAGGARVAFVGDGVNDAPALAAADVGVAIGAGADVAIESADVVLTSGDPVGVADAVAISRSTIANIRQNLFWAFAYNAALIPVAAGALQPFGGPALSPALAAGAMALSSLFVVANALRLRGAAARPR